MAGFGGRRSLRQPTLRKQRVRKVSQWTQGVSRKSRTCPYEDRLPTLTRTRPTTTSSYSNHSELLCTWSYGPEHRAYMIGPRSRPANAQLILSDTVSGSSVAPREQYQSSRSALLTCTDRANRAFRFRCRSSPGTAEHLARTAGGRI